MKLRRVIYNDNSVGFEMEGHTNIKNKSLPVKTEEIEIDEASAFKVLNDPEKNDIVKENGKFKVKVKDKPKPPKTK